MVDLFGFVFLHRMLLLFAVLHNWFAGCSSSVPELQKGCGKKKFDVRQKKLDLKKVRNLSLMLMQKNKKLTKIQ